MALKDWKKRDKDYWGKLDRKGDYERGYGEVIWIQKYPYRNKKRYGLFKNPGRLIKSFKTKSQALKYARSYMRRH